MAKTPSDKLHRLVRKLSPTEKRYFRIFIRGKTDRDSLYLRLFDTLCAMEVFDEKALKTKVYGKETPEGKKYSELKAYLYDLILKCLQSFDEGNASEQRLNHLLQSVAVLFRRGHYDDCRDLLQKAVKLAARFEHFIYLLEIIRWEKLLAYTRMDVDFLHAKLEAIEQEEQRILMQLQNVIEYRKAFFGVYATIKREAQHRGEDRQAQLRRLIQIEAFSEPDQAQSHRARVLYYRTLNLYHYAAQDIDSFYDSGSKLLQIIENQPHFLKENLSDYIAALSNQILASGIRNRYDEVRQCLDKLNHLEPLTEDDRRKIHRQYFTGKFALCQFTGEFEEARREMQRCQEEAAAFDPQDYETASFYFQYCYICFGCGDYSGALSYLNQWLAQPKTVEREDLQSLARMIDLILHYELDNRLLLDSLVRSTTRFLKQKNRLYELERRFLSLMNDLLRLPAGAAQKSAFEKIRQDWGGLPGAATLAQMFDIEAWFESKMLAIPFAEVVKQKFNDSNR